jgi:HAD superfamily 5'-nucleotidase-like hydrolase
VPLSDAPLPPPGRRLFCNRTLNLRAIEAIGFDMDYTLVHYHVVEWERRAYEHCLSGLRDRGFPVDGLSFDPEMATVGLVIDTELGNVVKANRFGFVKRAAHGTRMLDHAEQRKAYERRVVDLGEKRWAFVNTLFGMSEACAYMQLVDRLDEGRVTSPTSYAQLYDAVRASIDEAHMEGQLKAEIVADPARFVDLDPELPQALEDLRASGKKLLLVTNSEWSYTRSMMAFAFDRFLGGGRTWRSLFDLVIVSARKPAFFTERMPAFEVIDEEGHLVPATGKLETGKRYLGGHARLVEQSLGVPGEEILYVGDHVFSDVNVSKSINRWRTCLVLRDLEPEIAALEGFKASQHALTTMMAEKERLEHRYSSMRLLVMRAEHEGGAGRDGRKNGELGHVRAAMRELRAELVALDERIAPLAKASSELHHPRWGLLLRTGNDKSHLARQIERHADIYTSRVSNFLHATPFVYLRSPRGSLPHDSGPDGGVD